MTLVVQDDTGTVSGANGYISVAEFKTYHDDRANDYSAAVDDAAIGVAIVKATDYLDQRFAFVGRRRTGREQTTEWPRTNAYDRDGFYVSNIPTELKEACAEYALRAIAAALNPDPDADATGRAVQSKSESVGPISSSVTYVAGAVLSLPKYPAADLRLTKTGLVMQGGEVRRA